NWPTGNGAWNNFNGLIDEAAFSQRVLTPQEITAIFQAGSGGKASITSLSDAKTIALTVPATTTEPVVTPAPTASNTALRFDGGNEWVEVPHSPTLHSDRKLTVSGWFQTEGFSREWQNVLFKGGPNFDAGKNREYGVWVSNTGYLLFTYASTTTGY